MELHQGIVIKHCQDWLRYNGIYKGKLTIWSIAHILGQLFSIYFLGLSLYKGTTSFTVGVQYLTLSTLYSGLLYSILKYRNKLMSISKSCEMIPDIDLPWIIEEFNIKKLEALESPTRKYVNFNTKFMSIVIGYLIFGNFTIKLMRSLSLELSSTGTTDDLIKFCFFCSMQGMFFITAYTVYNGMVEIVSMIAIHIKVQYQILGKVMLTFKEENNSEKIIKQCIKHHIKTKNVLKMLQEIFSTVFFFIYFGLFTALAITRALMVGKHFDLTVLPIVVGEILYITPFSVVLDIISQENENLRFSIYNSNWLSFSKKLNKILCILMINTFYNPSIVLYSGGPPLNVKTFASVINTNLT